jgi:predicted O-methyltransferase YrrM
MNSELWTAVDRYVSDLLIPADAILESVLQTSADAGLPPINVAPNQGKFLQLLAKIRGAKNILEIGTLGGYSTLWLAGALPKNGKLVTLEFEPRHAEVARKNFANAGRASQIELRLGAAAENLRQLIAEDHAPFDFVFIDADKENYLDYFKLALRLSRAGTCIVADNVIRHGAVIEPNHEDSRVQGVRRFMDALAAEPRVTATAIQTVGSKGYDGFAIALVTS